MQYLSVVGLAKLIEVGKIFNGKHDAGKNAYIVELKYKVSIHS